MGADDTGDTFDSPTTKLSVGWVPEKKKRDQHQEMHMQTNAVNCRKCGKLVCVKTKLRIRCAVVVPVFCHAYSKLTLSHLAPGTKQSRFIMAAVRKPQITFSLWDSLVSTGYLFFLHIDSVSASRFGLHCFGISVISFVFVDFLAFLFYQVLRRYVTWVSTMFLYFINTNVQVTYMLILSVSEWVVS